MKFRCYVLYEDITDGKGLAYRHYKTCGLWGLFIFLCFNNGEVGKRIEWSTDLATEVLLKKKLIKHTEI